MKYCSKCGHQLIDEAIVCTNCGCSVSMSNSHYYSENLSEKDETDAGLLVLSIIIPIVGFILWMLKHKDTPKAAKTYGMAALIVCGVWIAIQVFIYVSLSSTISGIINSI